MKNDAKKKKKTNNSPYLDLKKRTIKHGIIENIYLSESEVLARTRNLRAKFLRLIFPFLDFCFDQLIIFRITWGE